MRAPANTPSANLAGGREAVWNDESWLPTFAQFAKASGLSISIYGLDGSRALGPAIEHPLMHLISEKGGWAGGPCEAKEVELARDCLARRAPVIDHFLDAFLVQAHPIVREDKVYGALVAGWVFDQFADPLRCARLARAFGIPENVFWLLARELPPISRERVNTFVTLFKTTIGAILGQQLTLDQVRIANQIKDQFLATASHELKTPLTSMRLRVQLLKRAREPSKEQIRHGLEIIDRGITVQTRLVDDMLETSRASTGKLRLLLEPVNPAELLLSAVETVTPGAESKGVQITAQVVPPLKTYKGDVTRLSQVFWNLLNNAVKFTPSLGFIRVTGKELAGRYMIEIADSGRGLEPANLERIFEPFFQVKASYDSGNNGMGLGLSVVKAILDLHGASIQAASDGPGLGAKFVVGLPSEA